MSDQFFTGTEVARRLTDRADAHDRMAAGSGAQHIGFYSSCDAQLMRDAAKALLDVAQGDVTLTKEQAYALFLIVDTTARIERGAYPTTNYLRELLLPTYRAWHDANPGTAHPALVVPSQDRLLQSPQEGADG